MTKQNQKEPIEGASLQSNFVSLIFVEKFMIWGKSSSSSLSLLGPISCFLLDKTTAERIMYWLRHVCSEPVFEIASA